MRKGIKSSHQDSANNFNFEMEVALAAILLMILVTLVSSVLFP